MTPRPRPWRGDGGSVSAEFAVALPVIVLVLAVCLAAVQTVGRQVVLADAAGRAARALGRGEDPAAVLAAAGPILAGARLSTATEGGLVCVLLSAPPVPLLPGVAPAARSCAPGAGA